MWQIKVNPIEKVEGALTVPGDKSISHRSVLFGALTDGKLEIDNFLMGEDCLHTVKFVEDLGVQVKVDRKSKKVVVQGVGIEGMKEPKNILDVGNAGTLIRIGAGLLAACPFYTVVTGDESIRQRPMGRVVEPLTHMGAKIFGRNNNSLAPLAFKGGSLHGITHEAKTASAQVKSAVLLAGLLADSGETVVKEPAKSRDHTERMLAYLGANICVEANTVRIKPGKALKANPLYVPGDISSAAFVLALGLLRTDSEVIVQNVGFNPSRAGIVQVLQMMGGRIEVKNQRELNGEPLADLHVYPSELTAVHLAGDIIPNIIDEIPVLAVLAAKAKGQTVIADAAELRVKESDRIRTTVEGLRRLGVNVEERPDGMVIEGSATFKGGIIDSCGDHRIAMAFAVAGLAAEESVLIRDTECINTSFPGFVETLQAITGEKALAEEEV